MDGPSVEPAGGGVGEGTGEAGESRAAERRYAPRAHRPPMRRVRPRTEASLVFAEVFGVERDGFAAVEQPVHAEQDRAEREQHAGDLVLLDVAARKR
jgi:hypothetical protein